MHAIGQRFHTPAGPGEDDDGQQYESNTRQQKCRHGDE